MHLLPAEHNRTARCAPQSLFQRFLVCAPLLAICQKASLCIKAEFFGGCQKEKGSGVLILLISGIGRCFNLQVAAVCCSLLGFVAGSCPCAQNVWILFIVEGGTKRLDGNGLNKVRNFDRQERKLQS